MAYDKIKIAQMLARWQTSQPIKPELQRQIDQQFMVDFNYNSNHLEGNTLTYGQTKLLLLFGRVEGSALMRDFEEMKAHNVGLEMMKREALDKERPLSENFIKELNNIILAGDYYKMSADGSYRYKIHVGEYKTRPNSVITPSGEVFDYASPEETPSLMADLIAWYREEEKKSVLNPIELAALFHYRYIRIHPFEDGNGRIARLIVNYILLRHGYPMIVIPTADRKNYLDTLGRCDAIAGRLPFEGANTTIEQVTPLVEYLCRYLELKFQHVQDLLDGKIKKYEETIGTNDVPDKHADNKGDSKKETRDVPDSVPDSLANQRLNAILQFIKMNSKVTTTEIAKMLHVNPKTVKRDIAKLKVQNVIERVGTEKNGYWEIIGE